MNGFIELHDWQYDEKEQLWCGYCSKCGYQIWRAEGLPVEEDEIKESIRCLDCLHLGCMSCFILNSDAEWLCPACAEEREAGVPIE